MRKPTIAKTCRPTIVTLTMNPALDITTGAQRVVPTSKIRCNGARYDPGGGGINVALIASVLGASVKAVFPAGGVTGDVLADLLSEGGISFERVKIGGRTRESFTVNEHSTSQQYRFVLPGPRLTFAEQAACLDEVRLAAGSGSFVVASGSLPPGVPADYYQRVSDVCGKIDALLILDTSGGGLQHMRSGIFLLKASLRELRECVGGELATEAEQYAAAQDLIARGITQAVVISLGARGAMLVTKTAGYRYSAIRMRSGSGVGAGDAMVAAITVGLAREWPLTKAVQLGVAAGAAMLMTPGTAGCRREDVERLFPLVDDPADVVCVCR